MEILLILLLVGYYVIKGLAANEEKASADAPRHEDPMPAERWAEITKNKTSDTKTDFEASPPERNWAEIAKKNKGAREDGSFGRAFEKQTGQVEKAAAGPIGWRKQAQQLSRDQKTSASGKNGSTPSAAEMRKAFLSGGKKSSDRPSPVAIREFHEKRLDDEWEQNEQRNAHERALSAKRFASARTKQADEGSIHAVHIDSCEGRLESLKVLYDAGILDREEYRQRVARVKKQHRESRQ